MFPDKIDITKDLGWYRESDNLTDVDLKFLVLYFEKHYGLANEKRIDDAIKVVANENRYHPVQDYCVRVHFNEDAKETMKDKIKRMLENDVKASQHTV